MSGTLTAVTDSDFKEQVINSKSPVLVDFWAEWCEPCKMLTPRVETLAGQYAGKIKVFSMDVDANPEAPSSYGIRSIPTLLFFKEGKIVGELVGAHPNQTIEDIIKKII